MGSRFGAKAVPSDSIYDAEVDIFAPCALGAVINDDTVARLRAPIVAGSANNQLAEPRHGAALRDRGILYAPDYAINAGGVIDVASEHCSPEGYDGRWVRSRLDGIGATLDFLAGRVSRAPQWIARSGFEWLYRLAQEPRRMAYRCRRS